MRRLFAALMIAVASAGAVQAEENGACAVASALVTTDAALPRVSAALKAHRLDVAVWGTGSSILAGAGGADAAYPVRLQAALTERLPGVAVKVSSYARPKMTAAEMTREFSKLVAGAKPTLVVWQTGTADAMRGVDPDDFRASLENGVAALQAAGADVILVNMQYSPRTESTIAINVYADIMRWVSQHREIPLFDRFAVMKHWSELGTFDFSAANGNVETAAKVHDCIGRLLGDLIVESARLSHASQPKAIQ